MLRSAGSSHFDKLGLPSCPPEIDWDQDEQADLHHRPSGEDEERDDLPCRCERIVLGLGEGDGEDKNREYHYDVVGPPVALRDRQAGGAVGEHSCEEAGLEPAWDDAAHLIEQEEPEEYGRVDQAVDRSLQ